VLDGLNAQLARGIMSLAGLGSQRQHRQFSDRRRLTPRAVEWPKDIGGVTSSVVEQAIPASPW
jgi:hypothetical protein